MAKVFHDYFLRIETWKKSEIQDVLKEAKENKKLQEALYLRYGELLKIVKKDDLSALISLPKYMCANGIVRENLKWEPSEQAIEVLNTLPIHLIIENQYIYSFPVWITHIKKLKGVSFENIFIKGIPKELKRLKKLETLSIGCKYRRKEKCHNKDEWFLPEWLGDMPLKHLEIKDFYLSEIPLFITKMPNLEYLDLSYNAIKEIPKEIADLSYLKKLFLQQNKIKSIPKEIALLTQLRTLEIDLFQKALTGQTLKDFMNIQSCLSDDPVIEYYKKLESKDETIIKQAVDELQTKKQLLKCVEKRYLPYIRARLKNPDATLYDINKVALTDEDLVLIEKVVESRAVYWLKHYRNMYSFTLLNEEQTTLIIDFMGAMVQSVVDSKTYLENVVTADNLETLQKRAYFHLDKITEYISREAGLYTEGWFSTAYTCFAWTRPEVLMFNFTKFDEKTPSSVLREFYMYIAAFNGSNKPNFIFKNSMLKTAFNMIWAMPIVPNIEYSYLKGTRFKWPASPLSFERYCDYLNLDSLDDAYLDIEMYYEQKRC